MKDIDFHKLCSAFFDCDGEEYAFLVCRTICPNVVISARDSLVSCGLKIIGETGLVADGESYCKLPCPRLNNAMTKLGIMRDGE